MDKLSLSKVSATPEAEALLAEIIADHGPVLFHQSAAAATAPRRCATRVASS